MAVKIQKVNPDSLCGKKGITAGYVLLSINGYGRVIKKLMGGSGAYYVQIVYKDQVTTSKYDANFLNKANKGDSVLMIETDPVEVDKHGGIDKINVLVVYETMSVSKLGIIKYLNWLDEGSVTFK